MHLSLCDEIENRTYQLSEEVNMKLITVNDWIKVITEMENRTKSYKLTAVY